MFILLACFLMILAGVSQQVNGNSICVAEYDVQQIPDLGGSPGYDGGYGHQVSIRDNSLVVALEDKAYFYYAGNGVAADFSASESSELLAPTSLSDVAVEGQTVLVGNVHDAVNGFNSGVAYFLHESSLGAGDWATVVVRPQGVAESWSCGNSVSISGTNAVVACRFAAIDDTGQGAVFFYKESLPNAMDWLDYEVQVVAFDHVPGDTLANWFGYSVSISGTNAVVGAPNHDYGMPSYFDLYRGGAYFMRESALGAQDWQDNMVFLNSGTDYLLRENMGSTVAISGSNAIVSAPYKNYPINDGAVYFYKETSLGAMDWPDSELKVAPNDLSASDIFGFAVDMDGSKAVVASVLQNTGRGAVYLYFESSLGAFDWDEPNHVVKLVEASSAYGSAENNNFGNSVSISGSKLVVGSPNYSEFFHKGGIIYFYTIVCDYCASSPCQNDGTCSNSDDTFHCDCSNTGFQGSLCQSDIDDCASSPCLAGEACSDQGLNAYSCTDIDDCLSSPCEHGGSCTDNGLASFLCMCLDGFTGHTCVSDIDDCASSPCHSGTCTDTGLSAYSCDCTGTGFLGDTCMSDVDDCASSPCENGGICTDAGANSFTCDCDGTGFYGNECEADVNDCASSPCENGGICTEAGANSFICDCDGTGFYGNECETDVNDCVSSPCENGGVCKDVGANSLVCVCTGTGFDGNRCTTNIDDCLSSPCNNGATCTDGVNSFTCACPLGYEGDLCMSDIDDCMSSPCLNAGVCSDAGLGSFMCACATGWTGPTCTVDVDDCHSSPCNNGGTCVDQGLYHFECQCRDMYIGELCETVLLTDTSSSSAPLYAPVYYTIVIEFDAFANDTDTEASFAANLKDSLLPSALGGDSSDYQVSVLANDNSYEVTISAVNRRGYDETQIERVLMDELDGRFTGDARVSVYAESVEESNAAQLSGTNSVLLMLLVWPMLHDFF